MNRALALTGAVAAAGVLLASAPADAAVRDVRAARLVVVASRTVTVPLAATLTGQFSARGPWGGYEAEVWVKGVHGWVQVGTLTGDTPRVTGRARLDVRETGVGVVPVWLVDPTDGDVQRVTVTLKRRTVVSRPFVEACGTWVYVRGLVRHYSPVTGGYGPSKASPVRVQKRTPAGWVTVATLTTDTRGVVAGYAPVGAGRVVVRLVRLDGATVTAATSASAVTETVPGWC
jgi:hypothetical protein